jgi:methyl-accepting chemotaxis protein
MAESVHVVARVTRSMILLDEEPELMEQEYKKIVDARALYDKAWGELQKFPPSERAAKLRARSEEARRLSGELNDQVLALARARKTHEATTLLLKQAGPATTKWQEALHENIELQHETARHDEEASREAYVRARTWMLVLLGGSMAFGLLIAWLIVTSITRPLAEAVHVAQAVARGDLSRTVEVDREDEAGQLLRALKEMTTNLAATVEPGPQQRAGAHQRLDRVVGIRGPGIS